MALVLVNYQLSISSEQENVHLFTRQVAYLFAFRHVAVVVLRYEHERIEHASPVFVYEHFKEAIPQKS